MVELNLEGQEPKAGKQLHSKDRAVIEAVTRLEQEGKTPEEVIGQLITGGAQVVNYCSNQPEWQPKLPKTIGREMVFFTGTNLSPRWGAETLRQGFKFALPVDKSRSLGNEPLLMIPYFRCDSEGNINTEESNVFLLRQQQVDDLKGLFQEK